MRTRVPASAHVAQAGLGKREDMGFGQCIPTGDSILGKEHTPASAKIAVLVPAHNEGRVIDRSLARAVEAAGRENIYLVADGCEDETVRAASYWIGRDHIHETPRSGKGPALLEAIERFELLDRYDGIFMSDADTLIEAGTMEEFGRSLVPGVGAVIGHIRVLDEQSNLFASWRRYQYFWCFNLIVRAAAVYRGCFTVTPGCATVYSTRALRQIEHDPRNPAEDMDFCFQIHRRRLGRIAWNPRAWVQTADPLTLPDYRKQVIRWGRGWWYNVVKHRVSLRFQPVDLLVGYFIFLLAANWLRALLVVGLLVWALLGSSMPPLFDVLLSSFAFDFALIGGVALFAAVRRQFSLLKYLPLFPVMLFIDLALYGYACATQRRNLSAMWTSPIREKGGNL